MVQIWFLYSVVSGLSSVVFNYINRYVLKDGNDSTAYAWWFEFFRLLIFLPFFLLTFDFKVISSDILLFALIGFSEFFSVYFYMRMHAHSELSISTTMTQLRLVWVPIFALLFINEKLEYFEYFGILMILLGQIITTFKKDLVINKGIKAALLASFFIAINNVIFKKASGVFVAPAVTVAMTVPSLIIFPIKMNNARNRILTLGKSRWKKIFVASVFNAFSMVFLIWALRFGPVGKVTAVFQGIMIVQVFVGIALLNEKTDVFKKLVGAIVVAAGILLLI